MVQPPLPHDSAGAGVPISNVRHVPLHAHSLLRHAASVHADATITSVSLSGLATRMSYAQLEDRALQHARQLRALGVGTGDVVVNMGVSSAEQLAWLYGALSIGATTHLMNPLLLPEQVLQLIAAAHPSVLLHDTATAQIASAVPAVVHAIPHLNMDAPPKAPAWGPQGSRAASTFSEESPAIVCYSSGTTGLPKAAQYTHRSTVLHAWGCALPDAMALTARDRVLPLMQMFHATAWGAPFVSPLVGASLILVPPSRDPKQWYEWIEAHEATVLGAVTAHWMALVQYMQANKLRFSTLLRTVVGGTRLPEAVARVIAEGLGVEVRHAWGMTETSPLATMERYASNANLLRHGKPVFGVELRVGNECAGARSQRLDELQVRGHWVAHRGDGDWLQTGDWAALHADGHLEVIDRMEDALNGDASLISSALVEFHARRVPGAADAALVKMDSSETVLAWVRHPQADEATVTLALRQMLAEAFGGWTPDHLMAVDALPYTHSAKVQKNQLKPVLAQRLRANAAAH
ncbi:AMP-binding protein [Roseateles sp. LKC17W]|uniref:AMP-binding protein n=1 Tax=Pelomonas margarita TaxID=3299031 RepID=A0ABW7FGE4_9BURK